MRVFLSHAFAVEDGPMAVRIRAIVAIYGIQMVLADRVLSPGELETEIARADAVLALATLGTEPQCADY